MRTPITSKNHTQQANEQDWPCKYNAVGLSLLPEEKIQRVLPSKESHRRLDPLVHKIASPTAKSNPGWSTRTFQEMTSSSHTIDHSTNEPLCLACFGVTHYPLCDTAHHLSSMGQFYIGISSVAPSTSLGRPLLWSCLCLCQSYKPFTPDVNTTNGLYITSWNSYVATHRLDFRPSEYLLH